MDLIFGAATLYADRDAGTKFRCVEYSFKDPLVSFAGILQSIHIEQGSVWAGLVACIQAGAGLVGIGEIMCDLLGGNQLFQAGWTYLYLETVAAAYWDGRLTVGLTEQEA